MSISCENCFKEFNSSIDLEAHILFIHGISIKLETVLEPVIMNRLQKKYDNSERLLSMLCNLSEKSRLEYQNYIGHGLFDPTDKYCNKNSRMTKAQYNHIGTKKAEKLKNIYEGYSIKWQKQVYRCNSVIREIESYGLNEGDMI